MASHDQEYELEDELEGPGHLEGEEFLGTLGDIAGGLLGEDEDELGQHELEDELAGTAHEDELEDEWEDEGLGEFEDEGEQFSFGKIFSGISKFAKQAAPILKQVAKVAAPMVGTAFGGPLGGMLGDAAASALGEDEFELEDEQEDELEDEDEMEAELEAEMEGPMTHGEALGELMCAVASRAKTDQEAEAMVGACAATMLNRADRRELREVLPYMVRAVALLQKLLRRRNSTRPAIRAIPSILKRSAKAMSNRAKSGRPVTRKSAARAMARQTRKVLSSPRLMHKALTRNVKATRAARRASSLSGRRAAARARARRGSRRRIY
jgi:hypothetical protein